MNNPFEVIEARLNNIESLILDFNKKTPVEKTEPQDQLLTVEQTVNKASTYTTLKQKGGALLKTVLLYLFRILIDYFLMQM